MPKYLVARREEIPPGGHMLVEIRGRSIGIFNVDGEYYGVLNRCPHQGAELCRGALVGHLSVARPGDELVYDASQKFIVCPWHGWEFDVKTGQSYFDPKRTRARAVPVEVTRGRDLPEDIVLADGTRLTPGPYMAETVPVGVEEDYVVVTVGPAGSGRAQHTGPSSKVS